MVAMRRGIVRAACLALAVPWLLAGAGCRGGAPAREAGGKTVPTRPVAEAIAAHADSLMAVPGVVGLYEGRLQDGTPCVKIMVRRLDEALRARLPRVLEGHPVLIEETGEIRAMPGDTS